MVPQDGNLWSLVLRSNFQYGEPNAKGLSLRARAQNFRSTRRATHVFDGQHKTSQSGLFTLITITTLKFFPLQQNNHFCWKTFHLLCHLEKTEKFWLAKHYRPSYFRAILNWSKIRYSLFWLIRWLESFGGQRSWFCHPAWRSRDRTRRDGGRRNRNNQFSGDKQDGCSAGDEIERMISKWQMPKKCCPRKFLFI